MTTSTTEQFTEDFLKKIEPNAQCSMAEDLLVQIYNKEIDEYVDIASQIKYHSDIVKNLYSEIKLRQEKIKKMNPVVSNYKKINT